jgi:hypothetical protein
MRRRHVRLLVALVLALGASAGPAVAHDHGDGVAPGGAAFGGGGAFNMDLTFEDPASQRCWRRDADGAPVELVRCIVSDIAFWGDRAVVGDYGGFRIFDISDPVNPVQLVDEACWGPQNDPSLWDTDGNGEADLLILSVDRTSFAAECPAAEPETLPAHDEKTGWEGLRLFDISNPADPQFIKGVYQDCGSHTNVLLPQPERGRVLVLNSSYPLRPGPTCGPDRGPEAGRDPLHGVIQVVEIPLLGSAQASGQAAHELTELPIDYPGDPDNAFDPAEHGLPLNPLRACHDMTVFTTIDRVAAACAEQSQLWEIDAASGLPDTAHPLWVFDRRNIDFHHSATFSWDGKIVNFIDESFGTGCPTVTPGVGQTGRMYFVDASSGDLLSHFMITRSHQKEEPDYCSAHLGNVVPASDRYLLVNAWYTGGVDVIDFSDPRAPREVAFWDDSGDDWSGYWYERTGAGPLNVFGTHGVEAPADGRGFLAFEADVSASRIGFDHLNPQVQDQIVETSIARQAGTARASRARSSSRRASAPSQAVHPRRIARRLAP